MSPGDRPRERRRRAPASTGRRRAGGTSSAERRFLGLLESAPDAMILVAADGKVVLANIPAQRLFGYPKADLLGMGVEALIPQRYRDRHRQLRDGFFAKGGVRPMVSGLDLHAVRKDGTEFPVEISLNPIEAEQGTLMSCAIRDITDRKRFDSLIEINLALAAERDPESLLTRVCRAARELVGSRYAVLAVDGGEPPGLRYRIAEGMPAEVAAALEDRHLSEGAVGAAFRERRTARLVTADGDPGGLGLPAGHPAVHSVLVAPIASLNRTYGWICLSEKLGASDFSEQDEKLLETLGAQAGRTYESEELYAAVQESEEKFRQLAEHIHDVFFLVDPGMNRALYVSPAYEDIWGRTVEELQENPQEWMEPIHPEDRAEAVRAFDAGRTTGRFDCEYRVLRPDGTVRFIHARGFPIHDSRGDICRIAGIAEDVTQAREAADELRESERRFRHMLENVRLISIMLDRQGCVTFCNDYLLTLTGWGREDVLGKDWFERFIPKDAPDRGRVFQALIEDAPAASHHESEILVRSGERRLIRWSNSVLKSPGGQVIGTASIGEDITERRRSEEKIRRLNRVYAILSGINGAIVRNRHRQALFEEACRILIQYGRFDIAWIGLLDGNTQALTPVAWRGPDQDYELIMGAGYSADADVPGGQTTVGQAVRDRRPVVNNDLRLEGSHPLFLELFQRGYRSVTSLPLLSNDACLGVVGLYSREAGVFDSDEMQLLTELSNDIAFALEHIRTERQVEYLAFHDPLTGLGNRSVLHRRLTGVIDSDDLRGLPFALLLMNINDFRDINYTLGHANGDRLLKEIAGRVVGALWESDIVACLGGDEFAILLPRLRKKLDVDLVISKISTALERPFLVQDLPVNVDARLGIALYPDHGNTADLLWQHADIALRAAKNMHRPRIFYDPALDHYDPRRLALIGGLRAAMDHDELTLHYQPRIELRSGRTVGVEALVRWQHPEHGLIYPDAFVPLAERTGMIDGLTSWVLTTAVRQGRAWHEKGLMVDVSVNLSARNLQNRKLAAEVVHLCHSFGFPLEHLVLEITETAIMANPARAGTVLAGLCDSGVRLALDDFGIGQASLGYVRDLPLAELKIDKSFVTDSERPRNVAIVRAAIELGHSLGLVVVAEGIESRVTFESLRDLGCDLAQGYFFSRPLEVDELTVWAHDSGWRWRPE